MNKLRKAWKWFSGKKTAIGYIGVQFLSMGWAQNHIAPDALELMQWGFGIMGGVGVAHKLGKSEINKKIMLNLNKNKK